MLRSKEGIIVYLVALAFCYSSGVYAKRSFINKIEYTPSKSMSRLTLNYNGEAGFKLKYLKNAKQYILEINGQEFHAKLTKRLKVKRRLGPISEITPYNVYGKKSKSRLLIQLRKNTKVISKKSKGKYFLCFTSSARLGSFSCDAPMDRISARSAVELRPEEAARQLVKTLEEPKDQRVYKGETVSLDSIDVSVHDVFRIVGDASGLNVISGEGVSGNISLSVKDVPWDQLLDLVLQSKKLKVSSSGNVLRITTFDEYTKEQEKIRVLKEMKADIEPVFMDIIPISFANAEDIKASIASLLKLGSENIASKTSATAKGAAIAANQPFTKGKIEVDVRTNSLLVTHTVEQIKRVRNLVKQLDVPSPQVLIEARIVSISDNYNKTLGINWSSLGLGGDRFGLGFAINPIIGSASDDEGDGGDGGEDPGEDPGADPGEDPGADPGTGEDTGSADSADAGFKVEVGNENGGGAFGMRLGTANGPNVSFYLDAAELNGKSKTIASPRLLVSNKETATITDGRKIRVTQTTGEGNTAQTFVDAVLSLTVTPQITNSGFVVLDLDLKQDVPADGGELESKSVKTKVLVQSGSTLVLGGVYNYGKGVSYDGVPILMDLPFIGPLFVNKSERIDKSELLMFVTPRISNIPPSLSLDSAEDMESSVLR